MKHGIVRSWRPLLALCVVTLLAACGGAPARDPEPTSPPPTAEPAESTNPATEPSSGIPTVTPTPEATETAAATLPAAETKTPSPTPTAASQAAPATPSPPAASRCRGLGGTLEVQVLVGPAEAVGLEPLSAGHVPFTVTGDQSPYWLDGAAPISYEAVLEEKWGTYSVTMDLEVAVSGECTGEEGSERLELTLEMAGEQLVVVEAEGFQGEYPWSGSHSLSLSYPLEEGATAEGEGWVVVLHLGSP